MELDNIYNCDCLEGMSELPTDHKYCIVTDPPFNVGYHYNEYKDNKSEDEYFEWLEQSTAASRGVARNTSTPIGRSLTDPLLPFIRKTVTKEYMLSITAISSLTIGRRCSHEENNV